MRLEYPVSRRTMCAGLALIAIVAMPACSRDKNTAGSKTAPDTAVALTDKTPRDSLDRPIGKVIRPNVLTEVAQKDGKVQLFSMDLVQPTAGFSGGFTTYKTQDMQMAYTMVGSVGMMTLTPMFTGVSDPDAFIQIQFDTVKAAATDPAGAALAAATKGLMVSRAELADVHYAWADAAKSFRYSVKGRPLTGVMIVAHHGPNTFHVMAQSPQTRSVEMMERLNLLLKHWRWDDYSYLVPSGLKPAVAADSAAKAALPAKKPK